MKPSEDLRDRLVFDSNVSDDSPVVKGTWVTQHQVVSYIVDGWTWSDILRSHPELTEDDIRACIKWGIEASDEKPGPLKIVRVEYRRLKPIGRSGEETIGAAAEVATSEDAERVLEGLKTWVESKLNMQDERDRHEYDMKNARREKEQIESEIERCKDQWEKAKAFLAKHGVSLPEEDVTF